MLPRWRRRTRMSPSDLYPDPGRVIGRLLALRSSRRTFPLGTVCGPSPEPAAHWRTKTCRPSFASDGLRVQRGFEGAENRHAALCHRHRHGGRPSIRVWGSPISAVPAKRHHARPRARGSRRQALDAGKNATNPLLGKVCLLTTGVLIRVRHGLDVEHHSDYLPMPSMPQPSPLLVA